MSARKAFCNRQIKIVSGTLFYLLIGGGLGAALGHFNRCRAGACSLTANWRRGAIYGVALAGVFCLATGCGGNPAAMNESTANVKHITQAEFDAEVMSATQPVGVDCYATWCGPCKMLAPIVDSLAEEYAGKIKFFKVNVDESPKVARQFQIEAIPALLMFQDGKLVEKLVGLQSKENLARKLAALWPTNVTAAPPGKSGRPGQ